MGIIGMGLLRAIGLLQVLLVRSAHSKLTDTQIFEPRRFLVTKPIVVFNLGNIFLWVLKNVLGELDNMRAILGINYFHDSSAALLVDGELKAAVEQERIDRHKHSGVFPSHAVRECLNLAGVKGDQITDVVCGWHPRINLSKRILSPFRNTRKVSKIPEVFYRHTLLESVAMEGRISGQIKEIAPKTRIH